MLERIAVATCCALLMAACTTTSSEEVAQAPQPTPGQPVAAEGLEPGDCFDATGLTAADAEQIPTVDCAAPHDYEVTAVYEASSEDGAFPGDIEIEGEAVDRCGTALEEYAGTGEAAATLNPNWIAPTEESWASGFVTVTCYVFDATGAQLTGSVQGIG